MRAYFFKENKMIIVCGWHKKYFGKELVLGEKEPLKDKKVTHGICKECEKIFYEKEINNVNIKRK